MPKWLIQKVSQTEMKTIPLRRHCRMATPTGTQRETEVSPDTRGGAGPCSQGDTPSEVPARPHSSRDARAPAHRGDRRAGWLSGSGQPRVLTILHFQGVQPRPVC